MSDAADIGASVITYIKRSRIEIVNGILFAGLYCDVMHVSILLFIIIISHYGFICNTIYGEKYVYLTIALVCDRFKTMGREGKSHILMVRVSVLIPYSVPDYKIETVGKSYCTPIKFELLPPPPSRNNPSLTISLMILNLYPWLTS